ncbi:MAG: radical SAM family heme chaperone HemW [Oliverpabstia sp.]
MKKELELYIHIPFCLKKCAYCDFLSGPESREMQEEYVNALCEEIRFCGDFSQSQVVSIFIGGGTPSVLPGEWISKILHEIQEKFDLREDAEISIEVNPGTADREKIELYRQAGINRISFGCQSADNRELKMLGRIHTWEEFLESYHLAREAGFDNINVDLMSGLPEQTCENWESSLRMTAELGPEHISAYSLIIEEGTPFAERNLLLPDEDTERKMYEDTRMILAEYGYHQYEISNYAREGRECRHNLGYWKRTEYLGLGLGSASLVGETRFSNTDEMKEYLHNSRYPLKIRKNMEILNRQEQIEEYMILGLRLTKGVSKTEFYRLFGEYPGDIYGEVIRKYVTMGFMENEGEYIRLTRNGISVSNPVLAEFLS